MVPQCVAKEVGHKSCYFNKKTMDCHCPTTETQCPDNPQCVWYQNGAQPAECIHNTEKIYLGLDKVLKKRGKTNLALQVFYNKKPAPVSAPMGPFGYLRVNAFPVSCIHFNFWLKF